MATMVSRKCKCCGDPFQARVADVKRGWAKFCSKTCKAIDQEKRTGQYAAYKNRSSVSSGIGHHRMGNTEMTDAEMDGAEDGGWDAHKGWF